MKAAVKDRYGPPPDVVRIEDIERPAPSGDQLLVRVHAASVNRGDLDGIYPKPQFVRLFIGLRRPRYRQIGLDAAGQVEAVGPEVTRFQPGDDVFGDMYPFTQGSFAEYVCAPERAFQKIGSGMTYEEAATLPHSAILALQGLRLRKGRTLKPGDRVLIDGAGGNVGPFAVQIAKSMGAEVTAIDSADKLDLLRSIGADHVLDYASVDYTRTGQRYDWILDTDSHHPILRCRRALGRNGVYITLGGSGWRIIQALVLGGLITLASDRWMGLLLWWKPFAAADVETLKEMVAAGTIRPIIDRTLPLSEVVDALRWVDEGRARGKVIVTM